MVYCKAMEINNELKLLCFNGREEQMGFPREAPLADAELLLDIVHLRRPFEEARLRKDRRRLAELGYSTEYLIGCKSNPELTCLTGIEQQLRQFLSLNNEK